MQTGRPPCGGRPSEAGPPHRDGRYSVVDRRSRASGRQGDGRRRASL